MGFAQKVTKLLPISCMLQTGCLTILFVFAMVGVATALTLSGGGGTGSSSDIGTGGGDLANGNRLSADQICQLLTTELADTGYNLAPYCQQIHDAAVRFNINPLFLLAIANKDSSLGTAGAGKTCRNPGNMEARSDNFSESGISGLGDCAAAYGGNSRWEAFRTYGDGMQAKAWLLRVYYIDKGYDTIEKIINRYAPPSENDTALYIKQVYEFMDKYGTIYPQL